MDPFETANIFDLVFTIARALISFAQVFYNFMTTPLTETLANVAFPTIPFIGDLLRLASATVSPYTPIDILAGGGFTAIMVFVILKKVVPIF